MTQLASHILPTEGDEEEFNLACFRRAQRNIGRRTCGSQGGKGERFTPARRHNQPGQGRGGCGL